MESSEVKFMNWVNDNYEDIKSKLYAYCNNQKKTFDEDIFQDTIIKIYDKIEKHGIKDDSEQGFLNYFFLSFKNNTMREGQYSRNRKKVYVEDINAKYDDFFNEAFNPSNVKVEKDLKADFSAIYLAAKAEEWAIENNKLINFQLWKIKNFVNKMTYKKLAEMTKIKNARTLCLEIKNYLKENVTKKEIDEAFEDWIEDQKLNFID